MKESWTNKSVEAVSIKGRINLLENHWIKSLKAKIPYSQIAENLSYIQYKDQDIICKSNDKVSSYYFLVQGTVNAYQTKEGLAGGQYFCQIRQPQFIGQSIYSINTHRSCTWKAIGTVKCCKINAEKLNQLTKQTINEYNSILFNLSTILDVDFAYLLKYQLYKKMTYRQFVKNTRITSTNERTGNKSIYFILEGECKFCLKSQYVQSVKPGMQVSSYQQHILNLCANQIIGVEPLLENQYKYDYIVNTAHCLLIELNLRDMRDSYHHFPPQLFTRMNQIYYYHKKIADSNLNRISEVQNNPKQINKSNSEITLPSLLKVKRFLQQTCLFMPVVSKTIKKVQRTQQPVSAFIPLKKRQQKTFVQSKRKDWRSYIKLPVVNKIID